MICKTIITELGEMEMEITKFYKINSNGSITTKTFTDEYFGFVKRGKVSPNIVFYIFQKLQRALNKFIF
jgi:hypothetical protein